MQLGAEQLHEQFRSGHWVAYRGVDQLPYQDLVPRIGPNSVDITLDHRFFRPKPQRRLINPNHAREGYDPFYRNCDVDPMVPSSLEWERVELELERDHCYRLMPGDCVLGAAAERFDCNRAIEIDGRWTHWKQDVDGRSTVGRMFLQVHMTAGFGDYGFHGAFTLEIKNSFNRPILLRPGIRIGQVFFTQVYCPGYYDGAYANSQIAGPATPKLGKDRF